MHHEKWLLVAMTCFACFRRASNISKTSRTRGHSSFKTQGKQTSGGFHEQEIIRRVLEDYDWRVRPRGTNMSNTETGGPVIVTVNIYLRSISKIDDVNMEYSAQFTFRESWKDERLGYRKYLDAPLGMDEKLLKPKFVVLTTTDMDQQIWMPDTFFQNEKQAQKHNIDKPNVLIRIHPDGKILYSVRLSLVLSCPMTLEYYPLDRQTCLIDLASYAYTTDDIEYMWKKIKPVQLKVGLNQSLPSFEIQNVLTTYCTSKTNTGEYSCLRTELVLRREYSYYLLQVYIPSLMLVIVSWVSFWLDKDAVPARVSLGVTTLLTMTTQASGINAKLPPVSYTKAIDVWIGVCLAFIFGALLEFALVNYAGRMEFMKKEKKKSMTTLMPPPARSNPNPMVSTAALPPPTPGPPLHHAFGHSGRVNPSLPVTDKGVLAAASSSTNDVVSSSMVVNPIITPSARFVNDGFYGGCPQCDLEQPDHVTALKPLVTGVSMEMAAPPCFYPSRPKRNKATCMSLWLKKYKERSKKIDVFSRILFPIGFFFFNCIYWTAYMI